MLDFHTNKKVLEEVSTLHFKHLRSRVASLAAHLKPGIRCSLSAHPVVGRLMRHYGGANGDQG